MTCNFCFNNITFGNEKVLLYEKNEKTSNGVAKVYRVFLCESCNEKVTKGIETIKSKVMKEYEVLSF